MRPNRLPAPVYYEQQTVGDQPNQVPVVVVVSRSTAELHATTRRLLFRLAGGATLVTLVGAGLAWLLVQRTLRPVRVIAAAPRSIGDRDLHRRVDIPTPGGELGELKTTFNLRGDAALHRGRLPRAAQPAHSDSHGGGRGARPRP